ncbi:MAG: hypothetical protein NT068_02760 [Candidatus Nomurabacteria bacterium]|nr:hypothetical protein [Candidatus Nomurabacteria bacterium]
MIYLIGGTPRVGKSTLSSLILERNNISVLSTDVIRNLIDFAPTKVGIKDLPVKEKSEAFFPYFLQLLKILQNKYTDYVIEGDLFTPEQLSTIQEQIQFKCCFLGTSNITLDDLKNVKTEHDWVSKFPEKVQQKLPQQFMERSAITKVEAEKCNFPYFDIYPDRDKSIEAAYDSLFK